MSDNSINRADPRTSRYGSLAADRRSVQCITFTLPIALAAYLASCGRSAASIAGACTLVSREHPQAFLETSHPMPRSRTDSTAAKRGRSHIAASSCPRSARYPFASTAGVDDGGRCACGCAPLATFGATPSPSTRASCSTRGGRVHGGASLQAQGTSRRLARGTLAASKAAPSIRPKRGRCRCSGGQSR